MKLFTTVIVFIFSLTLTQCSSSKTIKETPKQMLFESNQDISLSPVYFQKWMAGRKEGGAGVNLFFPKLINQNNYIIDKVYFRDMIGKIQQNKTPYSAKLTAKNKDIVMTNEPNGEYGNTMPSSDEPFPFQLKDNEAVISYIKNGEVKYYKIENIVEKAVQYFPSAPPKRNKE